jgi:hypothetical protein
MPLPPAAPRELLHRRTVTCEGYLRQDGLWDIEGRIVDVKTYAFDNEWRGRVEPGMPVHEMWIRLTIDDEMIIRSAVASTEFSPFAICGQAAPNFAQLAGLKIGPGFMSGARARIGKTEGCTHIIEMLQQVATTAFQTQVAKSDRRPRRQDGREQPRRRPAMLDTCYALKSDREVVRRFWPEFSTPGPKP